MDEKGLACYASCNKVESEILPLQQVHIRTTNGEEHVFMCASCADSYADALDLKIPDFTFHILGERTYARGELPSRWENALPLFYHQFHIPHGQLPYVAANMPAGTLEAYPLDTEQLPLAAFPLIEDFEVLLIGGSGQEKALAQYHVCFFSPSRGVLPVYFGYLQYTSKKLCADDFLLPIGSFTTPYFDFDQGWAVLVAANDEFVYLMSSSGLITDDEGYSIWFKVEKQRYYQQWEQAIQLARSIGTSSNTE